MDRMMFILLLCSLDAGRLLMVITAQQVSAVILTSETDRKEGMLVEMTCTATNLQTSNIVVWRTENPEQVLRWGSSTISTQSRFVFDTQTRSSSSTVQDFDIINVQRSDTDEYVCSVYEPIGTGGSTIVASSKVTLSVLYFPSSSFPVCSPAGPVTVDDGQNLYLECSSEVGNPIVAMTISQVPPQSNSYTWTSSTVGSRTILSSLNLMVNARLNNITFDCTITSFFHFPTVNNSCTIGPINVAITATTFGSVEPSNMITSTASDTSITTVQNKTANTNLAVIVGAAVGGVAAVLLITILIVICIRRDLSKCVLFPKDSKLDAGRSNAEPTTDNPRQSYNEHAGLESIKTSSQTTFDGSTTATSPGPRHTSSRHPESSSNMQTYPIYAQPNKVKPIMDTSQDVMRHPSSTEQTYDNPVFDQDIVTLPTEDRFNAPDKPIATIKPWVTKPPKKPQPYQPKSNHIKSMTPDNNLNHQYNFIPVQSPTLTPHQDETILPPSDPTYAEVYVPKRQPSSHDNPDGIVYADLDLQSDTSPENCPSLSADGQVVYAAVMTT